MLIVEYSYSGSRRGTHFQVPAFRFRVSGYWMFDVECRMFPGQDLGVLGALAVKNENR
jgi:hypothetical protein